MKVPDFTVKGLVIVRIISIELKTKEKVSQVAFDVFYCTKVTHE